MRTQNILTHSNNKTIFAKSTLRGQHIKNTLQQGNVSLHRVDGSQRAEKI